MKVRLPEIPHKSMRTNNHLSPPPRKKVPYIDQTYSTPNLAGRRLTKQERSHTIGSSERSRSGSPTGYQEYFSQFESVSTGGMSVPNSIRKGQPRKNMPLTEIKDPRTKKLIRNLSKAMPGATIKYYPDEPRAKSIIIKEGGVVKKGQDIMEQFQKSGKYDPDKIFTGIGQGMVGMDGPISAYIGANILARGKMSNERLQALHDFNSQIELNKQVAAVYQRMHA